MRGIVCWRNIRWYDMSFRTERFFTRNTLGYYFYLQGCRTICQKHIHYDCLQSSSLQSQSVKRNTQLNTFLVQF